MRTIAICTAAILLQIVTGPVAMPAVAASPQVESPEAESPEAETPEPQTAPPAEPAAEARDASGAIDLATLDPVDLDAARLAPPAPWHLTQADITASQWQRTDKPNGTAHFTVTKPLPLDWNTRIGADLDPAAPTPVYDRAERPLPVIGDRGTGTAWIHVAVPNIAAVELRFNAGEDQNQFGATLMRSVPFGTQYAVTFENRYALIEPLGGAATVPNAIAPARSLSADSLLRFGILGSGTSFAIGASSSTADNVTHSTLVAEQSLYGPLRVSATLSDLGTATEAKRITAGLRLNW